MNRQIKFRAWDKTYNLMNYKVQVGNTDYADKNYTCNSIWVDYGTNDSVGWMNADDACIDLMQFTGLLDDNGRAIYEGDIIEYTQHHFNTEGTKVKRKEVKWNRDRWNIFETNAGESDIKVIGNVFEDKRLLTQLK